MVESKKIKFIQYILEFIMMSVLYYLLDTAGIKKYAVVLLFGAILFLAGRNKRWSLEVLACNMIPIISYLLVGGVCVLLNINPQITAIKEIVFWTIPFIFAFALYVYYGENVEHIVDVQFICSALVYITVSYYALKKYGNAESTYAFVFGAFVLYYVYQKRWFYAIVAAVLMYFGNKKIVILGVAAVLLIMVLNWCLKKSKLFVYSVWSLIITTIYYYIFIIHSGVLKKICYSLGILANGRLTMYDRLKDMYEFSVTYIGNGIGSIANILECWNIPTYSNLHSDLLKFYIELGFMGLLIFLASYGVMFYMADRKFGENQMNFLFVMSLYFILLCATDNVSIYILYLIPVYSMHFAVLSKKEVIVHVKEDK